MNKNWVLTQDTFDDLLAWLHPNREEAGRKYEEIRVRLIKIFTCRGCGTSEDLADETINRVASRLGEITPTFVGEPARYFYGVANKVHLESLRTRPIPEPPPPPANSEAIEREFECLEQCLRRLTEDNRMLVLEYYQDDKQAKINRRRNLAERLGIALNALRIRAFRIRAGLEVCVRNCVGESAA